MHRPLLSLAALVLIAGCSKPAPQQQQSAAAPKHVPLFASHAQEIGVTRVELIRFSPSADGKPAPVYREADLRWDSREARDKGMATAGFKAVAGDLPVFATGGFTVLLGTKTN